jgi:hypothetical protein
VILLEPTAEEWWYLAGLIATDGCLIRNGRRVSLVAKDPNFLEMLRRRCLITTPVGRHPNGRGQMAHHLNISGRAYWESLARIGLTPAKSKTIPALDVPDVMFDDFLRGVIDGDGSIRRWHHPANGGEQWSLRIFSASPPFLGWLKTTISRRMGVEGRIHHSHTSVSVLKYGKLAAQRVFQACYDEEVPALERKRRLALSCAAATSGWSRSKTVGQVAKLANAADS